MGRELRPPPFESDEELKGRDLRGVDLRRCDLSGRDLSGADLRDVDLGGAVLDGVRATGANLTGARLRQVTLVEADLTGASLVGADLVDADFRRATLVEADLGHAVLDHTCLEGADLSQASLGQQVLRHVDLSRSTLRGARMSGAELEDGELAHADLSGADLSGAKLSFADLRGAVLNGANLDRADLSGANLERADLREASVMETRLAWVRGLDRAARRELQERGARVPVSRLAGRWADLNAMVRRRPVLFLVIGVALVAGLAVSVAVWVGGRMAQTRLYPLHHPGAGTVYEVDCGSESDRPYNGRFGYVGGAPAPEKVKLIQKATRAPQKVYTTDRRGHVFSYKFRVGRGWYEVQLHFVETEHHRRGARTFDIRIEGQAAALDFDILAETPPRTALVRRWGVWVDDGTLDLQFRRRHVKAPAKVNFIRVRRMDTPSNWRRLRGE